MEKKFGSAPLEKMIFLSEEKQQEWDAFDPSIKEAIRKNIHGYCSKLENKLSIEVLCHVINEMAQRIEVLEKKIL